MSALLETISADKVLTYTHYTTSTNFPDVAIAKCLADKLGLKHYLVSTVDVLPTVLERYFTDKDKNGLVGGEFRHNFLYDIVLYQKLRADGCDIELRGLAGGLFKSKWSDKNAGKHLTSKAVLDMAKIWGLNDDYHPLNSHKYFLRDYNSNIPKTVINDKIEEYTHFRSKFSRRVSPRTQFQSSEFNSVNPFYDNKFFQFYLAMPSESRQNGKLHLNLINRLCPKISEIPFLNNRKLYQFSRGEINLLSRPFENFQNIETEASTMESLIIKILGVNFSEKLGLRCINYDTLPAWSNVQELLKQYELSDFLPNSDVPFSKRKFLKSINNKKVDSRFFRLLSILKLLRSIEETDASLININMRLRNAI